ncbi:MAG TPA: SEC-C metal-binding domain-containing protein [Syntrophobacteria bacterium]|nr:SEC-C metal-binding domain-containing protein [Syntrophobacteria bacterium]
MSPRLKQQPLRKEVRDAILQVIEGGNPEEIARRVGVEPAQLLAMRDAFVEQTTRQALLGEAGSRKTGRNEPCPCGSGKKYKKCCVAKHEKAQEFLRETRTQDFQEGAKEEGLPPFVATGFDLLAADKYDEASAHAAELLKTHPEDDRLHDTLVTGLLASGRYDEAISICRTRWEVAREEKAFHLAHGYHKRQPQGEDAPPAHFYAPETWLEKYWIVARAKEYRALLPEPRDPGLDELLTALLTVNDRERFPDQKEKGLEERRKALQPTLEQFRDVGPAAIPCLLQVVWRYSWATLFIPELLAHYGTDLAIRSLIDISMFGYHFVSESCLKHLEALGARVVPFIRKALEHDPEFDPIKVGLIALLGNVEAPEVDEILVELLDHQERVVVDWAGLGLGKRNRVDLIETLEKAAARIGKAPRLMWAVEHLRGLKGKAGKM